MIISSELKSGSSEPSLPTSPVKNTDLTNSPTKLSSESANQALEGDISAAENSLEGGKADKQRGFRSDASVLVPSVCWEQAGGEVRAALYDLSRSAVTSTKDKIYTLGEPPCGETRPPVLGEEQKIGPEEDLVTQHNILMQGMFI